MEIRDDDGAARYDDATEFPDRAGEIRHVFECERTDHEVKRGIRKRERAQIRLDALKTRPCPEGPELCARN